MRLPMMAILSMVLSLYGIATGRADTLPTYGIAGYFPEPIYIALQNSDAVEVLPQGKVWHGFPMAHYIAIGPAGKTLAVSGFRTGNVYIADAKNGKKLATLKIGTLVQGVKISPNGRTILAVDASGNSVKVIDLKSLKVTHTISVGKNPHNVVFSRNGRLAYVTVQGANKLAVVNMMTFRTIREIPVTGLRGPHNLQLSRDGHDVWIRSHPAANQDGHVVLVNLRTRRVLESIHVGLFHGGIDRTGHSDILATDIGGDTVDVIDNNALGVIKRIKVGAGPHGVRLSPDGRWGYVSSTQANQVDVIDMRDLKVVQRIKTNGSFPFWIALRGNP